MWRRQAALALNGTTGIQASGKGLSSYAAPLPTPTGRSVQQCQVGPLLDQLGSPVASFTADGAFDRDDVYTEVTTRHPDAEVIVPPRSGAVPSQTAGITPTQRDRHIEVIAEHGRMAWQKASGYNWRALV